MKGKHEKTNMFFYKYYNDGIEDPTIFDEISEDMYMFVLQKINKYLQNKQNKLNYDQYTYWVYSIFKEIYIEHDDNKNKTIKQ